MVCDCIRLIILSLELDDEIIDLVGMKLVLKLGNYMEIFYEI